MWHRVETSALVTLVRTQGSSYRQPGARLLLGLNQDYAGTISGGCLEADLVRRASWLTRRGAVVEQYSTMFDDTDEIPFGLGCGGVVNLLLEPTDTPEFRALIEALERAISGNESIVLTWLPQGQTRFARAVLSPTGDFIYASKCLAESELANIVACVLYGIEPLSEGIFVERLVPPQRLFVLGAGDDAKPLVSMGTLLGWTVMVRDGRAQLARAERFPEAAAVSVISRSEADLQDIKQSDAVILMTHSYEQDRELLAAVLPLRPGYLGMLGARHRTSFLISEVAAKLGRSVAECCEQIQAPVGLNLGGDGPEAIALAVIAEIQASRTGQLAASRKLSPADIEGYVKEGGFGQYQLARCELDSL